MSKPRVVFVLGGPGSGKGTQCTRIEDILCYKHISAGECLREERSQKGSKYCKMIDQCMTEGKIVPVDITVCLLEKKMKAYGWNNGKFLIDGFPRNEDNYKGWNKVFADSVDVEFCLLLDCPENKLEERLLLRAKEGGRSDDNITTIRKRFKSYLEDTLPIVNHFEKMKKLKKINADQVVSEVSKAVDCVFSEQQQLFQERTTMYT
eukprot:TRINITY_DN74030_c0_g1_i1.p1 TRINITY_DN74030_c0_g1~~TRINITY_DN74030_c0_g1_i1.p1  ORF type:complete len:206 (+),score=36.45 TRINITY_DN74030_c0_g1_i1:139-756(+)